MILLLIVMIKNVIYLGSRYRHEGSSRKPKLSIKGICLNVKFTNIDLEKLDDFDGTRTINLPTIKLTF